MSKPEIYAKRQQLGEEAVRFATEVKLEALRQLGKMLETTPKNKGGNPKLTTHSKKESVAKTLKQIGLSPKASMLTQQIAKLPEEQFKAARSRVLKSKI